jgi:hypothetical protein
MSVMGSREKKSERVTEESREESEWLSGNQGRGSEFGDRRRGN